MRVTTLPLLTMDHVDLSNLPIGGLSNIKTRCTWNKVDLQNQAKEFISNDLKRLRITCLPILVSLENNSSSVDFHKLEAGTKMPLSDHLVNGKIVTESS